MTTDHELMANLLAIRTTVDNMLRLISDNANESQASNEPVECGHPGKKAAMGGNWFCPDCKAEWREESADE